MAAYSPRRVQARASSTARGAASMPVHNAPPSGKRGGMPETPYRPSPSMPIPSKLSVLAAVADGPSLFAIRVQRRAALPVTRSGGARGCGRSECGPVSPRWAAAPSACCAEVPVRQAARRPPPDAHRATRHRCGVGSDGGYTWVCRRCHADVGSSGQCARARLLRHGHSARRRPIRQVGGWRGRRRRVRHAGTRRALDRRRVRRGRPRGHDVAARFDRDHRHDRCRGRWCSGRRHQRGFLDGCKVGTSQRSEH